MTGAPYTNVTFPYDGNVLFAELLDLSLTPVLDPAPDVTFWACQFLLANSPYIGGYVGLQNLASGINAKGAIFSVWSAVSAQPGLDAAGAPIPGAIALPFSNEGTGQQCLIPFDWQVGTSYRLKVQFVDKVTMRAFIGPICIGTIELPKDNHWGPLYPQLVCWTERYLGDATTIRHSACAFGDFGVTATSTGVRRPPNSVTSHLTGPDAGVIAGAVIQHLGATAT